MVSLWLAIALGVVVLYLILPLPKPRFHKPPTALKRQLTRLTGHPAVGDRLVAQLRRKYPGKPERWYWEKAIFDLERDRRA